MERNGDSSIHQMGGCWMVIWMVAVKRNEWLLWREVFEEPCARVVCINGSANGRMLDGCMKGSMRLGFWRFWASQLVGCLRVIWSLYNVVFEDSWLRWSLWEELCWNSTCGVWRLLQLNLCVKSNDGENGKRNETISKSVNILTVLWYKWR